MSLVQNAAILLIIQELVKNWEDTDAFKAGVIDKNGKLLIKPKNFLTMKEKNSYTFFHRFVYNMKRIISVVPGGRTKIGSFAAALLMLKEHFSDEEITAAVHSDSELTVLSTQLPEDFNLEESIMTELRSNMTPLLEESAAATSGVVGVDGAAPGDEPPGPRKFAGHACFDVTSQTFSKCREGKNRYHQWSKYLDEEPEDNQATIRSYGKDNPGMPMIVKDQQSGAMIFLRR